MRNVDFHELFKNSLDCITGVGGSLTPHSRPVRQQHNFTGFVTNMENAILLVLCAKSLVSQWEEKLSHSTGYPGYAHNM